ncbi:MAG: hypothetical protein KatS3mg115_1758 [Candidatus Poribacteria bacterium]|nr:MAG: hypothetical protein KatS3mg115_1758 [Candidatus Poribacteria bacterium]
MSDLSDPASRGWLLLLLTVLIGSVSYLATILRRTKLDLVDALLAQEGRSDAATRRLVRRRAEYQAAYAVFRFALSALLLWLLLEWLRPGWIAWLLGVLLLTVAELLPQRFVPLEPSGRPLRWTVAVARGLYWITFPIAWPMGRWIGTGELRLPSKELERSEEPSTTKEETQEPENALRNGERAAIEPQERDMIYRILEFPDTRVDEVMVPRTDMTCLEINTPFEECLRVIQETRFSRIPVYEGTIDNIVGILHLKDLIPLWGRTDIHLGEIIHKPPFVVPESKRINELFAEFRRQRQHMAIVLDEYGGTKGLVTLEDLLEEIVGEIRDEFDREEVELVPLDERTYEIDARMHLSDLNEMLDLHLPEDSVNTLGGFLIELTGRVPQAGDIISYQDRLIFRVVEADTRRVRKVRMQILPGEGDGANEEE